MIDIGTDAANMLATWLGLLSVCGWHRLLLCVMLLLSRPTHIGVSSAEFAGTCSEFLASLSPSPDEVARTELLPGKVRFPVLLRADIPQVLISPP